LLFPFCWEAQVSLFKSFLISNIENVSAPKKGTEDGAMRSKSKTNLMKSDEKNQKKRTIPQLIRILIINVFIYFKRITYRVTINYLASVFNEKRNLEVSIQFIF